MIPSAASPPAPTSGCCGTETAWPDDDSMAARCRADAANRTMHSKSKGTAQDGTTLPSRRVMAPSSALSIRGPGKHRHPSVARCTYVIVVPVKGPGWPPQRISPSINPKWSLSPSQTPNVRSPYPAAANHAAAMLECH